MSSPKYSQLEDGTGARLRSRCGCTAAPLKIFLCCVVLATLAYLAALTRDSWQTEEVSEDEFDPLWQLLGGTDSTVEWETTLDSEVAASDNMTGDTLRALLQPGYVIENTGLCPDDGDSLQLLVLVTSAPDHLAQRMAIRYTWGHFAARSDVAIGFFLGAVEDVRLQEHLREEHEIYKDIVQSRNVDKYEMLSVKTASMLDWVDDNCPHAPFVLKTDDDMFVNIPVLMKFQQQHDGARNTIFGRVAVGWKPFRDPGNKYLLTMEQFNGSTLPEFVTGPAYLMTRDVVRPLYLEALDRRLVPLEDVFFTGIVAHDLCVNRVHSDLFHNYIEKDACKRQKSISIHGLSYKAQFALWSQMLDGNHRC
ncbi:hypothetical protein PR048_000737 [Dryococelus australis]|uniref:Hexosyltransferase n=1 Tax=Dryococelus australis TaxID=614101 RepID=A0ABQ9IGW0_9NEOP|nr:hypothetical protein PR048_000737 [Dryococelus australis]